MKEEFNRTFLLVIDHYILEHLRTEIEANKVLRKNWVLTEEKLKEFFGNV